MLAHFWFCFYQDYKSSGYYILTKHTIYKKYSHKIKLILIFIFAPQHIPFATTTTPISDLAKFYRECFHAPQLNAFTEEIEEEENEAIENVTEQLEQFELSLGDYDSLVSSLCSDEDTINKNSDS